MGKNISSKLLEEKELIKIESELNNFSKNFSKKELRELARIIYSLKEPPIGYSGQPDITPYG